LQTFGLDPISWINPYNPITGSLGNPNFASSFLAMSSCGLLVLGVKHIKNIKVSLTIFILIIFYLVLIYRSNSIQGFLVFVIGTMTIFAIFIYSTPALHKFFMPVLIFNGISLILVTFGIAKKGPFSFLYKDSIRQRGYYWDSAIEMMKVRPFSGVGLDSFGDWYYQVRSVDSAIQSPLTSSSAAHNVFLDMGSNGGFPLFIIYAGIIIYTFMAGIKFLKNSTSINYAFTSIFSLWICYQAQSLISINQIGVAIWGWATTGLVIGFMRNSKNDPSLKPKAKKIRLNLELPAAIFGLVLGVIVGLPSLLTDANFRSAYIGKSAENLISVSLKYPEDSVRTLQAAEALSKSGLLEQSDALLGHILKVNPRSYGAWQLRYQISEPGSDAQIEAKTVLNKLNPQVKIK
jgi:hypothetical protein